MAQNWEPPEWWRKWKPLRWLFGIVVIASLWASFGPEDDAESEIATPVTAAAPEVVAVAPVEPVAIPTPEPTLTPQPPVTPPSPPIVPPAPVEPAKVAPVVPPTPVAPPAPAPKPVVPPAPKPAPITQAKATPPAVTPPAPKAVEPIEPVDPATRFTAVASDRVVFMSVLRSFDSVEAVNAQLSKAGFSAAASTIEKKVNPNRYPPYRSDTLQVDNYKHAGYEGKLILEFFNDRLYEAQFLPKDPRNYLQWLRTHNVNLPRKSSGRSTLSQGNLQVVSNIDFATSDVGRSLPNTPFVLWEDRRLVQQMRDWGPLR